LASAHGLAYNLVAGQLRCSPGMVNNRHSLFLKSRLAARRKPNDIPRSQFSEVTA